MHVTSVGKLDSIFAEADCVTRVRRTTLHAKLDSLFAETDGYFDLRNGVVSITTGSLPRVL